MEALKIKITGSGTAEEIAQALIQVATNIRFQATHPEGKLDGEEWEDATLMTEIEAKEEPMYILRENGIQCNLSSNKFIELDDKIREEELHEYSIIDRKDFLEELMRWIGEANKDKELMKQDLEMLMEWEDDYILSSNSTNSYIGSHCSEFNETCEELIKIQESL
jgi:hypothetical protein